MYVFINISLIWRAIMVRRFVIKLLPWLAIRIINVISILRIEGQMSYLYSDTLYIYSIPSREREIINKIITGGIPHLRIGIQGYIALYLLII